MMIWLVVISLTTLFLLGISHFYRCKNNGLNAISQFG